MKFQAKPTMIAAAIFGAVAVAAGLTVIEIGKPAVAGIQGSKHDLSAKGIGTDEICVFCHTPHGAAGTAPLWNRSNSTTSFNNYSSLSMEGSPTMTGMSLACLSCHDGVTARNNVINKPGSGGWSTTGYTVNIMGGGAASPITSGLVETVANLSTDLSNDHPVGIPYCGGTAGSGVTSSTTRSTNTASGYGCKDGDFNSFFAQENGGGYNMFWIDTTAGTTNTRDKTDIILYSRASIGGNQAKTGAFPYVECGSCHDPHNTSTSSTTSVSFLRITNTGSRLCLACHNK